MAYAQMEHELEPRLKLLKELGDISGIELFTNHVLVAVYQRPEKTKSGIFLPGQTRDEDQYQSKVGLVIKKGAQAFVSTGGWNFEDVNVEDWVIFRPSDGWATGINGVYCRFLVDTSIKGRVSSPDLIW
jgi:co-chaperonin GroES (HSP10)